MEQCNIYISFFLQNRRNIKVVKMAEIVNNYQPAKICYVYVNSYTHEYEITNIPTDYEIKHVGVYVGAFSSYNQDNQDIYQIFKYRQFDILGIDELYRPHQSRPKFCFVCHDDGHWSSNCPEKTKRVGIYTYVYVNPVTHQVLFSTQNELSQHRDMDFVGTFTSYCNEYSRYCLKTRKSVRIIPTERISATTLSTQTTEEIKTDNNQSVQTLDSSEKMEIVDKDNKIKFEDQPKEEPKEEPKKEQPKKELKEQSKSNINCFFCNSKKHKKGEVCSLIVKKESAKPQKRKGRVCSGIPKKKKKLEL